METCYKFTALFLLYLLAVIECKLKLTITCDTESTIQFGENLALSKTCHCNKSFDKSATPLSCFFKFSPDIELRCPTSDESSPILCSVSPDIELRCPTSDESSPILCSALEITSEWSHWTDCVMSNGRRMMYRFRNVTCADHGSACGLPTNVSLVDKQECKSNTGDWSHWSSWSECLSTEEQYRHRSLLCPQIHLDCLQPSNGSSSERKNCTLNPVSFAQGSRQDDEKRYTLPEIILVAFGCLLLGVVLTALLFIFYMKRTQQGCFSKSDKEVQVDSKPQSGPHVQLLAENSAVKKYDPKIPETGDSKNENKFDESQYQSLSSNWIDNDRQTYNALQLKETRFHHHGNEPSSGRLKQTDNDEQTDSMTILAHETEGVSEYSRDSDHDGHNYFILESKNISRESKVRNLERPETYAKTDQEVKDSTLGSEEEHPDAAHEYFVLEHVENGHHED
ncbi:hypothetical protein CHS0354_013380 [Potamilus streckersoni]|uniref:Uncharacterized protein n=1 Tax=Potamilus streckersoni TaxID=2493646 RepID=A0AAE0VK64_9BIVA|nr:hypothetical protein CHS0354_013380 [Potamilus streckersoni]